MPYLVFSQSKTPRIDGEALRLHAARYFATQLEVAVSESEGTLLVVRTEGPELSSGSSFRLSARARTNDDLALAREAEARGRAGGMALLAERCPYVWLVEPADPLAAQGEGPLVTMCGICASVALGPVLPPDRSTLFGVRGAIERASRAAAGKGPPPAE